jgi:hypothetical protein
MRDWTEIVTRINSPIIHRVRLAGSTTGEAAGVNGRNKLSARLLSVGGKRKCI